MVRAIVAGAAGRMGKRIINAIAATEGITLSGAFERQGHPDVGKDAGTVASMAEMGVEIRSSLEEVIDNGDVLIDFTVPEATYTNIKLVSQKDLAMVIGTTGFSEEMMNEIREMARNIRCVMAPNMSIGVNVMFKIVSELANILDKEYDIEIVELHHRFKKDAPSGTALRLAQIMADVRGIDLEEMGSYGRRGIIGERKRNEMGIHAIRAGDIIGEHTVIFGGIGERIEFTHKAHSRDNFARGAVRAAMWIVDQPAGLYDMQDVLGLK